MVQGTVKWFGGDKGSGYIAADRTSAASVRRSAIEAGGYRSPRTASASRRRLLTAGDGAGRD